MEQLLNGRFEYEVPHLLLSETEVALTLDEGQNFRGELNIGAEDGRRVKGIVTTDHQRIVLAKNQFQGTASTIEYGVDTSGLKAGDEICGNITVSSNLEERCVRVHVSIAGKTMNISGQEIHSLADFVHLASHDFGAAYRFFVKKEFARLLQKEAPEQMALYQGLSHKPVTFQHLEEFLVALGQKEPVMLSAEQPEKTVLTVDQPRKETLYLYKNTWGYVRMEIEVQGDFLEVEKKVVTSEDFIGSVYGVEYIIHQEKIGNGRHYGRITVRQGKQELRFELEVTNSEKHVTSRKNTERDRQITAIARGYLDLAVHKRDYRTWYQDTWEAIEQFEKAGGDMAWVTLGKAWLYESHEETGKARETLSYVKEHQELLDTAEKKGAYLYLAWKLKMEVGHTELVSRLGTLMRQESASYFLLKLAIDADDSWQQSLTRQLYAMELCYECGCKSPLLYLDAAQLYLRQEGQLRRISPFTVQVLKFAQKEGILSGELLKRAAYLTETMKTFDENVYQILTAGYERFPSDEVLEAICKLVMKGRPVRKEYFPWYAKAVERNIRITRLYEYYIETMDASFDEVLPQVIRMYFSYSNTLAGQKKALIYANVIKNREKDRHTFQSYRPAMEVFTARQIQKGRMNREYAALYRTFLKKPEDPDSAKAIANVLFTHHVTCENPKITRVIVCHPAMAGETSYPMTEQGAYIRLYGKKARILLEDEQRRRYAVTETCRVEPLFTDEELARACGGFAIENPGLLLHLCGEQEEEMQITAENLAWYQQAARTSAFSSAYRKTVRQKLLEYYLAHPDERETEAAVAELEDSVYAKVGRISTIELLVRYGCYSRAFALTDRYGYEKIPVSCLFRLAHAMILEKEFTEDEELLYLASYVVKQGIYDEIVLCYLRDYFTGSIEDMCSLWDKIRGFQMESDKLEERILTWSVFVRSHPKWEQEMLESYIRQSGKEHVILAYLTYLAIGYFMDGKPLSDQMFDYLDRAWKQGWELDEICRFAMLKHLSTKPQLSEEEEKEAHTLLLAFTKQGLRFAFYKDLPEHLTEGFQLGDRMFIEERQRAEAKVTIHYRTNAEETWKSEPMRNMYQGIFVKEFLLFYGEKMEYYLTFTNRQGEGKTEVKTVSMTGEPKAGKTRYQLLNQMKAARAAGDLKKAEEAFQKYLQQEALVRNCFALVDEKKQQEDTTWNRKI